MVARVFIRNANPNFADFDFVIQRHRHHNRVEQMIAVGAPADDAETQVNFRRCSNLHAPLGNIAVI